MVEERLAPDLKADLQAMGLDRRGLPLPLPLPLPSPSPSPLLGEEEEEEGEEEEGGDDSSEKGGPLCEEGSASSFMSEGAAEVEGFAGDTPPTPWIEGAEEDAGGLYGDWPAKMGLLERREDLDEEKEEELKGKGKEKGGKGESMDQLCSRL